MINYQSDLILNVFNFLNVNDIANLTLANKKLNEIAKNYDDYILNLMIRNSKFNYNEFENDSCFRYDYNGNSYVMSFYKNGKIFKSKKDAFIKFRANVMDKY